MARRLQWIAIFLLVGFFGWFALPRSTKIALWKPVSESKPGASAFTSTPSATKNVLPPIVNRERAMRVVYPYSIIPGGVRSVEELKNAIERDPIALAHYAAFHLSRARMIRLDRDRSMHVSYRLGNQVYWTKRELELAKGETLITDGVHMARTRCGNLISDTVSDPVIQNEPTVQELDTPQGPPDIQVRIVDNSPLAPSLPQIANSILPPAEGGPPPPGIGNYPPTIVGPPGPPGAAPWPTPPGPTRVVSVPEPSTLLLLLFGLFFLVILRWRRVRPLRSEP